MAEEIAVTSSGARIVCTFIAGAAAIGIIWGTQHYSVENVPWHFDMSDMNVMQQIAAKIDIPEPPAPPYAPTNAQGEKVKDAVWQFLRRNGLSREQAAGIMGNIQAESGFRPGVQEYGSGIGYGLCQWSKERRTALEASVPPGKSVSDLDFQLDYLYREMHVRTTSRPEYRQFANEWDMMLGQGSVEDALVAFHNEFERSHLMNARNVRQAVLNARLGLALESYNNPSRFP